MKNLVQFRIFEYAMYMANEYAEHTRVISDTKLGSLNCH